MDVGFEHILHQIMLQNMTSTGDTHTFMCYLYFVVCTLSVYMYNVSTLQTVTCTYSISRNYISETNDILITWSMDFLKKKCCMEGGFSFINLFLVSSKDKFTNETYSMIMYTPENTTYLLNYVLLSLSCFGTQYEVVQNMHVRISTLKTYQQYHSGKGDGITLMVVIPLSTLHRYHLCVMPYLVVNSQ